MRMPPPDTKLDSFAQRLFRSAQQKQIEIFETDQNYSRIQTDSARPPTRIENPRALGGWPKAMPQGKANSQDWDQPNE